MKAGFGVRFIGGILLGLRGLTKEVRLSRLALERIADRCDELTGHRIVETPEAPSDGLEFATSYRNDDELIRAQVVEARLTAVLGRTPTADEILHELLLDERTAR